MTKLPPTILIEETDFANAWARAVRYVLRDGVKLTIGDVSEPKLIRDICATIVMTGDAIQQIEDRELHPEFPFRHIDQYCEEFTREYLTDYVEKPQRERFSYLYFERLALYGESQTKLRDQIVAMRKDLRGQMGTGISSNRNQAITWIPDYDIGNPAAPCLQRIWIRHLGNNAVEVHLDWRSRDLYTAWQANLIAIIDMLNREVIRTNNCKIVKLVDSINSLHIYEADGAAAAKVNLVPISPQRRT